MLLSFLLGGLIGFERERRNRSAGLRTHVLVAVGSTLITITSIQFFKIFGMTDPSRIAANIVVGIGFLGAGTIMKEGLTVRGLTTAASIWVASAIGLACGLGYYYPAIITSVITFLTLIFLRNIEIGILGKKGEMKKRFIVKVTDQPGQLGKIGIILGHYGINIENIKFEREEDSLTIIFLVVIPQNVSLEEIFNTLSKENWVLEVNLE
ncbi:MAG: methyltransferase [Caldiserica bacterium CG23_combo_of_CG06-09_8_20_14_all_35_60]|nr:MAG: methyltransferase [Caldiserica bacterium CG23_combo_of_CG06-09_8_20_14_all_35_60]